MVGADEARAAEDDLECVAVVKELARTLAQEAPDIRIVVYTFDLDVCDHARAAGVAAPRALAA